MRAVHANADDVLQGTIHREGIPGRKRRVVFGPGGIRVDSRIRASGFVILIGRAMHQL